MKLATIIFSFLLSIPSFSQISFSSKHIGSSRKFEKGVLKKFKKTETIFVFPSIYSKEIYEKILKESWTVTPYKIVDFKDFNIENFLGDKYSVADLTGFKKEIRSKNRTTTLLHTYFDFKLYNGEKILKKLNKLSKKKRAKKRNDIIEKYSTNIARFYVFPKDEFLKTALSEEIETIVNFMYTEDVFFNFKPGYLKNYLQKVNNLIKKEKIYWLYKDEYLPELKKLKNEILYIPSYISIKFSRWTGDDEERNDEYIKKLFKKYKYKYKIISDEDLNNRIINNEMFYYLRYVRVNSQKFLQVVNSKTGEVIYRNYIAGFSYNLKSKYIKDLSKKITKANRKK